MNIEIPELNDRHVRIIKKAAWALPVFYVLFFVIGFPLVNVKSGHTGIDLFFGKPISMRSSGISFKLPFIEVVQISNQARNATDPAVESPTHDLQVAKIDLNSQYSILPAGSLDLFTYYGDEDNIEKAVIMPGLLEVQKAISAKYNAYDLQQKAASIAEESKGDMTKWVEESLSLHGLANQIDIATLLFPHVEFSEDFKNATKDQTTTEQSIGTYENNRTQAKTDAEATKAAKIREAQATAYKIKADADAETAGIIAKAAALRENPRMLCYLVHKGWDGKLPEISNGGNPLPFADVCKGQ